MKVTYWGTRGSLATPGRKTFRYGGNTSCVQVMGAGGTALVLDAGTGMLPLSRALPQSLRRVDVLLTHLHMDHIQGLGFFAPFFDPQMEVHVWGPPSAVSDLRSRLVRYLSPPLFPVHLCNLPCKLVIHDMPREDVEIGEFRVAASLLCHPGPTVGYRITAPDGASAAYMPDHEPILGSPRFQPDRDWISGMSLAKGARFLIHDSQYTRNEYGPRVGWGHSTVDQALEFARIAEVECLAPFHHDPMHGDDYLDQIFDRAIAEADPAFRVMPAKEGDCVEVTARRSAEVLA